MSKDSAHYVTKPAVDIVWASNDDVSHMLVECTLRSALLGAWARLAYKLSMAKYDETKRPRAVRVLAGSDEMSL